MRLLIWRMNLVCYDEHMMCLDKCLAPAHNREWNNIIAGYTTSLGRVVRKMVVVEGCAKVCAERENQLKQ